MDHPDRTRPVRGPLRHDRPAGGAGHTSAPEELWHEWVHIDPAFRAEYPGCEEGMLRAAAGEEEWASTRS